MGFPVFSGGGNGPESGLDAVTDVVSVVFWYSISVSGSLFSGWCAGSSSNFPVMLSSSSDVGRGAYTKGMGPDSIW